MQSYILPNSILKKEKLGWLWILRKGTSISATVVRRCGGRIQRNKRSVSSRMLTFLSTAQGHGRTSDEGCWPVDYMTL